MEARQLRFGEIGAWSELKLEIVQSYAKEYSKILERQGYLKHFYIDGFAGAGAHISKTSGKVVPGSPINALRVVPPFKKYFFIDLKGDAIDSLEHLIGPRDDVSLMKGDCNKILLEEVLPQVQFTDYRRALCLLDPYGLHLNWPVIHLAAQLGTIEIFLNFPIMDMNRNALWVHPEQVDPADVGRMNAFWGDESWREVVYRPSSQSNLFEQELEKVPNDAVAEAFRERLKDVAGFKYVPPPIAMRNSTNATLYYLFFASQNETGNKIASSIFRKHDGASANG